MIRNDSMIKLAAAFLFIAVTAAAAEKPEVQEDIPLFTKACLDSVPEKEFRAEVESVLKKAKKEQAYSKRVIQDLKKSKSNHYNAAVKRLEIFNRLIELFERYLASGSKEKMLQVWLAKGEMESFIDYFHWEEDLMQEKKTLPASKVFSVKEFGAKGDGKHDDGPAIRKAIAAALALRSPATVFFPSGKYRIIPGKRLGKMLFTGRCGNIRAVRQALPGQSGHINIIEPEHLTLLGEEKTELIMTDPSFSGIAITGGYDTTVRNIAIDYDPLPFTQGKILSVSEDKRMAVVQIDPGYHAPDAPGIAKAVMWRLSLTDPKSRTYTGGIYPVKNCRDLGNGKYEFETGVFSKSDRKAGFVPGMLCDIKGRRNHTDAVAFADYYSKMTTLENVWVHSSPSVAYHLMSMAFVMNRSGVRRAPGSNRIISSNADGMMCGSSITLIGPCLENCLFDSMGDDGINSTVPTYQLKHVSEDGRQCRPMYVKPGENIYVIDGITGEIKAVSRVVSKKGKLQFDLPLPKNLVTLDLLKMSGKIKPGDISFAFRNDAVKLPDLMVVGRNQFGGTVITGTTYRNIRGLGVQLTSPSFLVENCKFDHLTGSGISGTALMSWKMYYSTHNAVIRKCSFSNVPTGIRFCCIPPYTSAKIRTKSIFDIAVEDNTIGPNVRNSLEIRNTLDAAVRGNALISKPAESSHHWSINHLWRKITGQEKPSANGECSK